jgi:hypothetical protein
MARRTLENSIAPAQRSGVPPVAPVIPSSGWWTGNNQLGNEVAFAPDANNRQTILKLEEWGPPEVWTVSLFLTHEIAAFNAFDVTAELDFGAGGSTQIVQMDWVNGAQISVPMNAIDVIATFKNVDITALGSGIRLGVQVGRGRRAGGAAPTLTMLDNVFLAANNVFPELVEVPAFAKRIHVVPTIISSIASVYSNLFFVATFSGNAPGAHNAQVISGDLLVTNDGIEVQGASRFIKITNLTSDDVRFSVYAELFG